MPINTKEPLFFTIAATWGDAAATWGDNAYLWASANTLTKEALNANTLTKEAL